MEPLITATFVLADWVAKGLADGTFERIGGVIRDVGTKQVVTWLREVGAYPSQLPTPTDSPANLLNLIFSGTNLVGSVANAAVSGKGLADVNQRLSCHAFKLGISSGQDGRTTRIGQFLTIKFK